MQVNVRSTLSRSRHKLKLVKSGAGMLLLVGATACGGAADGDGAVPSATSPQSVRSTSSPAVPGQSATTASPGGTPANAGLLERTPIALDTGLIEAARAEGIISVIVTLDIPYRPEAELASSAEVEAQRAAIAAAQDA